MSTSTTFELNCLILGEDSDHIFPVEIPGDKSVGALREAIKDEKNNTFQGVDADTFKLWKVSIANDEHCEEEIKGLGLESRKPLLPVKRLSEVFSGKPVYGHLHIVVQPPASVVRTNEPPRLELNCLMLGEDRKHIFPLSIPGTKTVGALREAIKDKKKNAFYHVDADALILWRVSIPDDDSLELKLSELNLVDESSLSPMQVLSEVSSVPLILKNVHIVVKPPPPYLLSQPLQASTFAMTGKWTEGLNIAQLEAAQDSVIKGALGAPPPSSAAAFENFIIEQETRPIWNGRPSMNHGIPIQLYHPSFAKFLRIAREDNVEIDLKPEVYSATHSLFHSSAVVYDDEARRVEATRMFLEEAIGHKIPAHDVTGKQTSMKFDSACTVPCGSLFALAALKEDKNEVGTGGCDPSHQCAMGFRSYYTRKEMNPIRDRCCCPAFLIALAGPWMCILGAVFVDHVVVQQLTDFIWIGGHPYNDDKLESVARILASLGTGIAELREFYKTLSLRGPQQDPQRFFPFIRQYSVGEHVVNFSYQGYLLQKTPESPPKAIFSAIAETEVGRESRREIVVKFVQRYNAKAHRLLATAHRAPELLYCSKEDPNPVDLAGLIMVVMEFIDGRTAHRLCGDEQLPPTIFNQVEEALGILHEGNIVFGDLRCPNIMVIEDKRVQFIDFDWCGEHEKDTYQFSLNDARNAPNSINWQSDVKRGGKMVKGHDIFMLDSMRPQSDITSLHNPPPATTSTQNKQQTRLGKRKARASDDEENESENV